MISPVGLPNSKSKRLRHMRSRHTRTVIEVAMTEKDLIIQDLRRENEWLKKRIELAERKLAEAEKNNDNDRLTEHIRELLKADKDGRVVVLPCKVGDELWSFSTYPAARVYGFTVTDISTLNGRTVLNTLGCGTLWGCDIGKTVFLTREEAEKALEARKDGDKTDL